MNKDDQSEFSKNVGSKAARKIRARRKSGNSALFGLGMMGLVGWSVVVPTLLGTALGIWLDKHYPSIHSWTLSLLLAGLVIGCINAWRLVDKEDKKMRDDDDDN